MWGAVDGCGQQKMHCLRCSWALPIDLKHNEACFSTVSTDLLHLQVAQMPTSQDLAIFMATTTRKINCFTR